MEEEGISLRGGPEKPTLHWPGLGEGSVSV